jgi:hypothetical protein
MSFVTARISSVQDTEDGKSKVYIISCETQVPPITWNIRKRYSEFRELYTRVKKESKDLEMPPKQVRKLTEFELEQRKSGLNKFLVDVVQLLSSLSPPAYQAIWTFLELHKMQQDGEGAGWQSDSAGAGSGGGGGSQNNELLFDTPDRHKQLLANLDKGTITLEQYNILVESDRKAADAAMEFSGTTSRDDGHKDSESAAKRKKAKDKADMRHKADQKMQAMRSMLDSTRLELAAAKERNDLLTEDLRLKDIEVNEWQREIRRKDARIKVLSTELQDKAPIQLGAVLAEKTFNEAGNAQYVQYTLNVQKGDRTWAVNKRYKSFFRFYRQLRTDCPLECKGINFPWRKPYKLNGRAIESRTGRLERYLQVLLSRQSNISWTPTTILQQHIYEFLGVPEEWAGVCKGRVNTGGGDPQQDSDEDEGEDEDEGDSFAREDEDEFRRASNNPFA